MELEKPPNWDWVTERFNCSINGVFERLRLQATKNVDTRNKLFPAGVKFGVEGSGPLFSVFAHGQVLAAVRFNLKGHEIIVEGDGVKVDFRATLTLTNSGDCRLKVDGAELTEWQVLRRALEDLLFSPVH
jgi:hypothetical protein